MLLNAAVQWSVEPWLCRPLHSGIQQRALFFFEKDVNNPDFDILLWLS